MKNNISRKISDGASPFLIWLIILGIPIGYLGWNFGKYDGPAFLDDEIGYLANAIFLSGNQVDGGSSYHAGFSLLLTPLFFLFSDAFSIWQGVVVINSVFWGIAFYSLNRLIIWWDNEVSVPSRAIVLLLTSLYPTWITMAGYAFTTSVFVALFMVGVFFFIKAIRSNGKGIFPFTICSGLLYWIHPIGLMTSVASIVAIGLWAIRDRKLIFAWGWHSIGCVFLISLYKFVIHPGILSAMTPEGYAPLVHYPDFSIILGKLKLVEFWTYLGVNTLGQIAYFLVGTFGLALFGVCNMVRGNVRNSNDGWKMYAGVYFIGSLLGVVLVGAVNFSLLEPTDKQMDEWIYGRYLDNVCMPILAISLLCYLSAGWRRRISLASSCILIVVLSGCIFYVVDDKFFLREFNTSSNVVAFWPQYIFPEVKELGLLMLVGAMAIALVYIAGMVSVCLLVPVVFVIGLNFQTGFHWKMLTASSARPTAILDIVRENYPPGAYISFDWESLEGRAPFHKQRMISYKFYFHNYHYQRVSKEGWERDRSDIILTYDPMKYMDVGVEVARESHSALYLIKKKSDYEVRSWKLGSTHGVIVRDISGDFVVERLTCNADEFINMSEVGEFTGDSLFSNKREGYLFFGPYIHLKKGEYKLTLYGDFIEAPSAVLDVVANSGSQLFLKTNLLDDGSREELCFDFHLSQDVSDLEIRLRVADSDRVSFNKYVIERRITEI